MDAEEREAFCIVERGQKRLGLPASAVRRVLSGGTLTPLPSVPPHVIGLVSDRGAPLPVVCIDPWIDEPIRACRSGEPVLVLEASGLRFGVVVDRVGGVGWLPALDDGEAGGAAADAVVGAVRATEGGPIAMLDPAALAGVLIAASDAAFAASGAPRGE
jgi:purine-binding chemotaxis protein CheW